MTQRIAKEFYPEHFTEDDKINFDILVAQAKTIFPKYEDWMIKIAVIAHINTEKGLAIPSNKEEVEKLQASYDLSNKTVYETPLDETVEVKFKEIIYSSNIENKNE